MGVGVNDAFLGLECGCELGVEVLFAFLGLFECFAEPLVLLPEGDSDEVDGFISGVFEVAVGDVDVAVETCEFGECDDLVFPLVVWAVYGSEVSGLDLFIEGFLRDAE